MNAIFAEINRAACASQPACQPTDQQADQPSDRQADQHAASPTAPSAVTSPSQAWQRRRLHTEDLHLRSSTDDWLCAMPVGVRPLRLPERFPRIANDLFRLWNDSIEIDRYFANIEFDQRGDRLGFAPIIREELLALHVHSLRTRTERVWVSPAHAVR